MTPFLASCASRHSGASGLAGSAPPRPLAGKGVPSGRFLPKLPGASAFACAGAFLFLAHGAARVCQDRFCRVSERLKSILLHVSKPLRCWDQSSTGERYAADKD